jgi:hypothetical protein
MIIAGAIVLLIAIGISVYIAIKRREIRAKMATETLSAGEIRELAKSVAEEVGPGHFSQRCEVVGKAVAPDGGPLKGPESNEDAVWFRSQVIHRYWELERDEHGDRTHTRRVEREEVVSQNESEALFGIDDGTGQVKVAPKGAKFDRPTKTVDRFEPHVENQSAATGLAGMFSSVMRAGQRSGTLGFAYREWLLRPGTQLYVHGEVSDASGPLAFAKPKKGMYVISTRSEEEQLEEAGKRAKWATIAASAIGAIGIVLIVIGLVV